MPKRHQHPTATPSDLTKLFKTGFRPRYVLNETTKRMEMNRGKGLHHGHITHEVQVGDVSLAYHATKGYRAVRVNRYLEAAQ